MNKHKLPLSVSYPPMKKMPAVDSPRFLLDCGFDAIDISIPSLLKQFGNDWREKTAEFKKALDESGIIVISAHLPFRAATDEQLHEDMLIGLEIASMLEIKRAVMHPIGNPKEKYAPENRKIWFDKNVEYYNRYLPIARNYGIQIVTENMRDPHQADGCHRYASTAEELIELADALGLEICWDFGHAHEAHRDHYSELLIIGKRLTMTHINDNWQGPSDEHLPPFYGTNDWEAACRGLREIGYSEPINFEVKFKQLPSRILPEAVSLVRAIGELLLDMIFEKSE
jgi:sugar phosphate isomerase/epimerase